jgi:hypothetical protein
MPMKTGLEVIEHVRSFCEVHKERILQPKFAIVTAFVTPIFKKHLSSLDIFCCLEKPIPMPDLVSLLQKLSERNSPRHNASIEDLIDEIF